eukprot:Protomagalhaensia_wolfi_Nauph_80__2193@NODE_2416_length_1098_cov_621_372049_g1891_i0_p1_GENE_NODE_2416_length_1098_cov_621_372049_g1891_i0NODE_2416_length_1098_cov_621_372049_g1891_i0_p1_ORF_typecomplete_len126_score1_81DUF5129/PF17173_4/0_048Alpha_GJ/PF03229_13/0_21Alpha_GJ/PF03229_13/3_3e03PEPCTERM/PF07589_11/20_NODE_2416_length_1098_cov_621_372049_g1891_i0201578
MARTVLLYISFCWLLLATAAEEAVLTNISPWQGAIDSPLILGSTGGAGLLGFGGLAAWLLSRRRRNQKDALSSTNTNSRCDSESFALDMSTADSCCVDDVMIAIEFLPSSPSSPSNSGNGETHPN